MRSPASTRERETPAQAEARAGPKHHRLDVDRPPKVLAMITLGIILLLIGLIASIPILTTIGVILLVVGVVLYVLGSMGRAVGGRNHYW